MKSSIATVATENASRYLQQLCKHWGHRFRVTFDPHRGVIDFGDGQSVELAASEKHLEITILDDKGTNLPELEKVVAEHLLRFAFRETLAFNWVSG